MTAMVVALVLVRTVTGKEKEVLVEVKKIPEVVDAHLLLGVFDISIKIKVDDVATLTNVVNNKIRVIPGILETRTLPSISFEKI